MPDKEIFRPYQTHNLVRIGSTYDGGYIVPKQLLADIDGVLSFGVYYNWDFEEEILSKSPTLKKVVIADPFTPIASINAMLGLHKRASEATTTIDSGQIKSNRSFNSKIAYILEKSALYIRKFCAFQYFLFRHKSTVQFLQLGLNGIESATMKQLDYFFCLLPISKNILIKMDIEGDEYTIDFDDAIDFDRVSGILIELHDIDKHFGQIEALIAVLKKNDLYLCHLHLNNSSGLIAGSLELTNVVELSFVKKQYITQPLAKIATCKYPITGLDNVCEPKIADFSIAFN